MKLSRLLSLLSISAFSLALFATATKPTQAATLTAGSLIKASGPSVYYFSADGKRYAFPDQATYRSWYTDFSGVQTISDTDLAAITFGGLVTIRPGSSMVKITTDPRVYALSRGGILHWVTSEALARSLYGETWNRQIVDIPDAFFTNYQIRTDVLQISDFSSSTEQLASLTIDADLTSRRTIREQAYPPAPLTPSSTGQLTPTSTTPVTPTPTSTPITPTSTNSSMIDGRVEVLTNGPYTSGDTVTVLASVTRGFADRILLSFGATGTPSVCSNNPCRGEFLIPNVQATTTLQIQAIFEIGQGTDRISNTSTASLTVLPNRFSSLIRVIAPAQVSYGSNRDVRVEVDPSLGVRTIQILIDGTIVRDCTFAQLCQFTEQESRVPGTRRSVSAIVTDLDYRRIYSDSVSFDVVQ
jgi:hypothetical protein